MVSAEEFPLDMRAALQDQHSADVIVTLLTFTRPGESEPVRVSTDKTEPVDFSGPVTIWGTRSPLRSLDQPSATIASVASR